MGDCVYTNAVVYIIKDKVYIYLTFKANVDHVSGCLQI